MTFKPNEFAQLDSGKIIQIFSKEYKNGINYYQDTKGNFYNESDLRKTTCGMFGGKEQVDPEITSKRYEIVSKYLNNQTESGWQELLKSVATS